jgi:hypothetical protein
MGNLRCGVSDAVRVGWILDRIQRTSPKTSDAAPELKAPSPRLEERTNEILALLDIADSPARRGVVVNAWAYLGEAHVERKALKDFPSRVAKWEQVGTDAQFDSETLAVLRASDYLLRNYKNADGSPD